ncbi:helix-turn-helix transcriptional regulator [Mesorhizobium sp. BAC0120]|uniref:helix-turn-helix domain-containing protein n=1 Tax=Mesorhizobium sp. BAC0120 TaxID=3090670 RepID=UPI00298CD08F|nr:helix-turn-helix transcriptional regulator [Mesorhizobium sp. BAC0120]MDW6026530.1 helix-turn-helix transcriptional regulator [Mesorhizobium sp. BAC0120]
MADGGDSLEDIGRCIRDLREAMGYDKASLFAEFMGWPPPQLSNYETGQKRPEVSMAIQLCRNTHVTLNWIHVTLNWIYEVNPRASAGYCKSYPGSP